MAKDLEAIALEDMGIEDEVVKLRDEEELGWAAIAEQVGVAAGKAMFAYMKAKLPKKEVVKGNYETRCAAVVSLRDEGQLSWAQVAVRVNMPESHVHSVYTKLTGKDTKGLRLEGKAGRPAKSLSDGSPKKAKAEKAAPAAKAAKVPSKAVKAPTAKKPISEMDFAELKARLEGSAIMVTRGTKTQTIKVKVVKSLEDGVVTLTNSDNGGAHTVKVSDITKVGTKK